MARLQPFIQCFPDESMTIEIITAQGKEDIPP
jgi:hypothetical protein